MQPCSESLIILILSITWQAKLASPLHATTLWRFQISWEWVGSQIILLFIHGIPNPCNLHDQLCKLRDQLLHEATADDCTVMLNTVVWGYHCFGSLGLPEFSGIEIRASFIQFVFPAIEPTTAYVVRIR